MAQTAKSNVEELNVDVAKQMAILRDDIANLTATVAEYGKAQGVALKATAAQKAADVAESGAQTAQSLKTAAEKTYASTEDAVRENPAAAVGIAAGIGFLVGLMARR